ncbi:FadR/GntR family transcriptional regulator [Lysinibacter cavernae]|uniref:DNA-binding FadR family transcriptional regulator n=1 Tax=Lysinibacter cavernae TaxID=1640652 RepID=A0A7X5R3T8_9MICO|nr:FadR/GntR family transcriptional regulator [Lysinibacter cavernae]NIH55155.1 DNA-binding FadR family transcriptional regulator [Lysinibacter cavernae]
MSAVDTAFHGLRNMIADGRISAGSKLPTETDLSAELGVARGSVREAVRMLGALGLVETRHGSGTYVSALRAEDIMRGLSLSIDLLPFDGLIELYEMRKVIESHATSLACARLSDEQLGDLSQIVERMESTEDSAESARLDHVFHRTIVDACGNPALGAFLEVFAARSRMYQIFVLPEGHEIMRESNGSHKSILNALLARDPVAAASAAFAHVAQTENWLRQYRPVITEDPVRDASHPTQHPAGPHRSQP